MPLPVRPLTVLQNWDCQGCSACCRQYHVSVSPEEMKRIEGQGWEKDPEMQGVPYFVPVGGWLSKKSYRLNHREDGACVFLDANNACRIHQQHGSAAKPLACRVYPFMLIPSGDHWKLGIRFACPSTVEDRGKPLAEHLGEARVYAEMLESQLGTALSDTPAPPLQGSQSVSWSDLLRIFTAISKILANEEVAVERRWRKVLFVVEMLRKAKFDGKGDPKKAVTAGRLSELLHVLSLAAEDETPQGADEVPRPSWVGRMVFRPLVALYARKDSGLDRGTAQSSAMGRLLSGVQFARGSGAVPKVHRAIPDARFADADRPLGKLSDKSNSLLSRWARVKVESGQFCGPANFGLGVWDGLESLAMTFPAAMWLARIFIAGGATADDAIAQGVRIVDDNFGFNKLLGSARQKFALRLLTTRGELSKLIAWYGK
jgi:lysine-N-methylase